MIDVRVMVCDGDSASMYRRHSRVSEGGR
jgi:hypothetical protein